MATRARQRGSFSRLPEVVASRRQNDAVRGKALLLHHEGHVAVLLSRHQRAQLLRQQVHVIDLRHGAQRPQRVTVAAHRLWGADGA